MITIEVIRLKPKKYKCPLCGKKLKLKGKEERQTDEYFYYTCECSKSLDIISINGKDFTSPKWRLMINANGEEKEWAIWEDEYDHMYVIPNKIPIRI